MVTHDIRLDMRQRSIRRPVRVLIRRGDNETHVIRAQLTDDGVEYEPTGTARLDIMHSDGTFARVSAEVSGNVVSAMLPSEALNAVGECKIAYFAFVPESGKRESTEGFGLVLLGDVASNGSREAWSYDDQLQTLFERWSDQNESAASAESARAGAEAKRVSAESARVSAEAARASESARAVKAADDAAATAEAATTAARKAQDAANSAASRADESATAADTATEKATAAATAADEAREAIADIAAGNHSLRFGTRSDGKVGPVLTIIEED